MNLLILGATGPTGRHLASQALEAGHSVAALVRDPSKLNEPRIEIIKGDATDSATIASAARGRDAVPSALGTGKSFKSGQVVSRAAGNVIAAHVKRLLWVSAFGVGESFEDARLLQRAFFRTLLSDVYADKKIADDLIRKSSAEWTIVLPVGLRNGLRTGNYRVAEHLEVGVFPTIHRADVADFMIRELIERKWVRKTVEIST
ncbi:MAG TPA: NAD(P)H-binding protein [Thermoanaerobaculia bacterium]|nr:NAD(P)H-binding protein [Thermoanaerobaculia bacterium]